MNRSRRAAILIGAWFIGGLAAFPASVAAAQASGTPGARTAPQEVRTEPLRPAPQSIREKWGIRVFLVWLWFTTGALLYLLRRMIREADRVYELGSTAPKSAGPEKCEPRS